MTTFATMVIGSLLGGCIRLNQQQLYNRGGANLITGKPLFDAKENFSGLWIIEAADAQTARELAFAASKACNRKVELRPFH